MKIERVVCGAMCVGGVRLLPIDVGFDLKLQEQPVTLPTDEAVFAETGVGYEDRDGRPCCVYGTRAEVIDTLRAAGYRIA